MTQPPIISVLASYVTPGTQGRFECPKCRSDENTLSLRVTDSGALSWRCFRASCGFSGGSTSVGTKQQVKESRPFTRPTRPLTESHERLLFDRFGLATYDVTYCESNDRFILPVWGPSGWKITPRGVIAYSLSGETPKSLTYNEVPDEPWIHYAKTKTDGERDLVIVEDWFSAEKVAMTGLAWGVAIMGTHLCQPMITEIAHMARKLGGTTWLALDKDAHAKALGYLFKYREQFPGGLFCWTLERDLKYETVERITAALIDGKTNFQKDAYGELDNSGGVQFKGGV